MESHDAAILAELDRLCPPGWQAPLEYGEFEVIVDDPQHLDALDAYMVGDVSQLREHYRCLLPSRQPLYDYIASQIAAGVGLELDATSDELRRIAAMVAERDVEDPLDVGAGGAAPEVVRMDVGDVEDFQGETWDATNPWNERLTAREELLEEALRNSGLWHQRMESHVQDLAWFGEWGDRARLHVRFVASPGRVQVPNEGAVWDWLLVLTREDGVEVFSRFDDHGNDPLEALHVRFTAPSPARMDRAALRRGQVEAWEYPSGLFVEGFEFVDRDDN